MIAPWTFRTDLDLEGVDLTGFDVEARDGDIGKVDEWSQADEDSYLVVDTGFWIFGKKRIVPARAVKQVNVDEKKVFVDLTKEQVEDAPDHHPDWAHTDHREPFEGYYGPVTW